MEIHGKIAIVTGAGAGVGRAIALELAGAHAAVVVADIDAAGGDETVRRIEALGGRAAFLRAARKPDQRGPAMFPIFGDHGEIRRRLIVIERFYFDGIRTLCDRHEPYAIAPHGGARKLEFPR